MREMVCITCPNGCTLQVEEVDGLLKVSGNKCKRGEAFAANEWHHPMRTVCTTVRTLYPKLPVIPVRITKEIPKSRIFDIMKVLEAIQVKEPIKRGDILISDILGLGVDVIVTSDVLYDYLEGEGDNESKTV